MLLFQLRKYPCNISLILKVPNKFFPLNILFKSYSLGDPLAFLLCYFAIEVFGKGSFVY